MNNNSEYNTLLNYIRLFAAIGILSHHSYLIGAQIPYFMMSGYMFVSLFFMITGYLTIKKLYSIKTNSISDTAITITINKIKKVYFFVILIVIFEYIYKFFITGTFSASSFIFESLLLYFIAPQKFNILLPHLWYLSSLFLAIPIFSIIYLKYRNAFKNLLCWFVPILILCYLMNNLSTLAIWSYNLYFLTSGFLLAIMGLFLGGFIFFVSEKLKEVKFTVLAKFIFTLIFILNIVFIIYFTSNYYQTNKDLITLISMFTLLLITTSNITLIKIPNNKITNIVGKIGLPLYIVHWLVGDIINNLNLNISFGEKYIIYLVVSIFLAGILLLIQKCLKKIKLKHLFIAE